MKNIIIILMLISTIFILGCNIIQKTIEVPILESYCMSKGSSNCCDFYGCFVKVKVEEEILTHEYLHFEEDTCSHSSECNFPNFEELEHLINLETTKIKKINGKYEFIELVKEAKSNR